MGSRGGTLERVGSSIQLVLVVIVVLLAILVLVVLAVLFYKFFCDRILPRNFDVEFHVCVFFPEKLV